MGGMGSGRQSGRSTTSNYRALDVRQLQRRGLLIPGNAFGWNWTRNGDVVASIQIRTEADRVILDYRTRTSDGGWSPMVYPVLLEKTDCNLGGERVWFRCPAQGCRRRVAVLYSGTIFACRHCLRLAYESQREISGDRAMRRADAIRRRLGWPPGIANPMGGKPKGMHLRTYARLMVEYATFCQASLASISERFGLMNRRLGRMNLM